MKATGYLVAGIITGAVIGRFLGFLRLPLIERNPVFLMGFMTCAVPVVLAFMLLFAWNKHSTLLRLIGRDPEQQDSEAAVRTYGMLWMLVAALIASGVLFSSFLIYRQGAFFKTLLQKQNHKIREQSELIESIRNGNTVFLMSNILDHAEEELNSTGTLSDAVIARIAALGFSFKPYRYLQGDSLSAKAFSPERGQLLMALLLMKMDSASFASIKQSTSFSGADLGGANLKNADLSGADLSGANLKDAGLNDANLKQADLKDAILWGADLNRANLSGANLKRADLRWAELSGTDLTFAVLDGAQLSGAILTGADVRNASVQYADLGGALLNEAKLTRVNLIGTGMSKVNLNKSDLSGTNLRMIRLNEASLVETELEGALVDSNWIHMLHEWRPAGAKEIEAAYRVVSDTLDQWGDPFFRLRKAGTR